ncbi:hypothetical protein [Ornithinimicrobium tianjinense]|uniref:Uncharacterized protein n=1 Tax=Ornithinimicrobium tianjinense TaxID=1195761 RepID=A0A917BDB4_9MICO|nr:hypothetical protein [Ornithinimicrobium tianjinense]GGF38482.1 hypothetical protein GCM10011366_02570 [Ornithinimicrobium tianjinense]
MSVDEDPASHVAANHVAADEQAADERVADEKVATSRPVPPRRARRRHRRVMAPPTNPDADGSDDLVRQRDQPGAGEREDPRDAWIRAQRPPHWD